jgi:hypothetical protein
VPANYINTLELTLDPEEGTGTPIEVHCQGTNIALVPRVEGGESVQTFCPEPVTIPGKTAHDLHIEGLQDWGMVGSLTEIIHAAWKRGADSDVDSSDLINYVLTVGSATRSGECRPATDVEFGGAAGSALTFTVDLPCVGTPTDGTVGG